ncbi:MAG TPA: nucleotidyltransferase family protein [Acidimicrobiales bacterium]|nr:nucleotidyltransferase family protein [Acidimicrobiales bacterium]
MTVAAVVLAAGGGTRFGGATHKLLSEFRGRPLVEWAVERALEAGLDDVLVVSGAVDLRDVVPAAARVVANPRWAEGQATSLTAGIAAADAGGHDAVVIGLGDQPLLTTEAWRLVAATDAPVAVATYRGERRHPVRLSRSVWPLMPTEGDTGARVLFVQRPELVVEVACPGEPADVDTVEDLDRWS